MFKHRITPNWAWSPPDVCRMRMLIYLPGHWYSLFGHGLFANSLATLHRSGWVRGKWHILNTDIRAFDPAAVSVLRSFYTRRSQSMCADVVLFVMTITFVPRFARADHPSSADVAEAHSACLMYCKLNFLRYCSGGRRTRTLNAGLRLGM